MDPRQLWVWWWVAVAVGLTTLGPVFGESSTSNSNSRGIFGGLCPEPVCECDLDIRGRMEVACLHGHMYEIPMSRMNPSTEVIRIVAPTHQANHLTIGRFFRQFKRLEELHIVSWILKVLLICAYQRYRRIPN